MSVGGKRPGAGRPKGSLNKATKKHKATLEELARQHTKTALRTLIEVAEQGETDSARVSAANALLDRGYGRPKQGMELTGANGGPIQTADTTPERMAQLIADMSDDERAVLRKIAERAKNGD